MKYTGFLILVGILVAVGITLWKKPGEIVNNPGKTYQDVLKEKAAAIQKADNQPVTISAWIAWWDGQKAINSLNQSNGKMKVISPMWYQLSAGGKMTEIPNASYKQQIKEAALGRGIDLMPTITNNFDPEAVSKLLDNQDWQSQLTDNLVATAQAQGYKGWDIDWEEMYPGDQQGFSDFVKELADKLHQQNMQLSVTVQAKTGLPSDNPTSAAEDWPSLSQSADQIRLMAYDWHDNTSSAGPISPLPEYEKALEMATAQIPKEKIIVGLPTYGYDWVNSKGEALQYDQMIQRLKNLKVSNQRDPDSAELVASYWDKLTPHTVWFEDATSMEVKVKIAKSYGLTNFIIWRLGGEDPGIWNIK
ncbi:glycosyl hydrolase family 18 protein [Patescibacteria group bacterium]|nr:glycosyl hydrolase family 18 protein [Patescibacteria group bacterium]